MGLQGPKIDANELYEIVIKKKFLLKDGSNLAFLPLAPRSACFPTRQPTDCVILDYFYQFSGREMVSQYSFIFMFWLFFQCGKIYITKFIIFNYFSAYSSLALTTFMMCADITTLCFQHSLIILDTLYSLNTGSVSLLHPWQPPFYFLSLYKFACSRDSCKWNCAVFVILSLVYFTESFILTSSYYV